jgi:anti-sigma factor RsiW
MMNDECRRTVGRLTSYVDDLLPAGEQAELEQHLDRCGPCRSAAQRERGARTILRTQARELTETTPPPGLRSRCEALVRDHASSRVRRRPFALRPFASVTAVVAAAVVFLLFSLATHRSDTVLAAQLTADHAKCFRLFASGESSDEDARRVEQMLQQDYGWSVHVPPSSVDAGVHLIGARRCLYADGWLPHVMYRVNGHDVSLYMLNGVTRPASDLVSLGHRSHIWNRGDRTYVLVWPVSGGEMPALLRYVIAEAR